MNWIKVVTYFEHPLWTPSCGRIFNQTAQYNDLDMIFDLAIDMWFLIPNIVEKVLLLTNS